MSQHVVAIAPYLLDYAGKKTKPPIEPTPGRLAPAESARIAEKIRRMRWQGLMFQ